MEPTTATEPPAQSARLTKDDIVRIASTARPGSRVRYRRYTRQNDAVTNAVYVIVDCGARERSLGTFNEVAKLDEAGLRAWIALRFAEQAKRGER